MTNKSFDMFLVVCLLFLLPLAGSKDTACRTIDGKNLQCKFPENINSTKKDFSVYFHPETGGEEKVVDCVWISKQLHCIRQAGFECKQPVSDDAVIDVPTRFVKKTGSYRCNINGYRPKVISSCRFEESQNKEQTAACEANATVGGPRVTLNCKFSFNVDSFSVKQNTTVVATFTKSECQSSSSDCSYQPGDSQDMFSVKLDVTGYPHGEYICHPESSLPQLQVQRCMVSNKEDTESPSRPLVAVILSGVGVMGVITAVSVAGIIVVIRLRRKHRMKRNENAEVEETEHFEAVT